MHRLSAVIATAVPPFAIALLMGPPRVTARDGCSKARRHRSPRVAPPPLGPGEQYTIADLHPMPLFGMCTGGH
jgi:hypothetical protein